MIYCMNYKKGLDYDGGVRGDEILAHALTGIDDGFHKL